MLKDHKSQEELKDLEAKFNARAKELNLLVYSKLNADVTTDKQSEKAFEKIFQDLKEIFNVLDIEYELYLKAVLLCPKCKIPLSPQNTFSKDVASYTLTYSCESCNFTHTREIKI